MDQHAFYKADILKAQVRQIFPSSVWSITVGLQMNMNMSFYDVPKCPLWKRSVTFLVATSPHFTHVILYQYNHMML